MTPYPTEQGFYTHDTHGWERSIDVPCCRLRGDYADYAVMRRHFCYVDEAGAVGLARIGFPYNGANIPLLVRPLVGSPWKRHFDISAIHDSDCAQAAALPPGPERNSARMAADVRLLSALRFNRTRWSTQQAWFRGVRVGALCSARSAQGIDYTTDLEAYYAALGLSGVFNWVNERVIRHSYDDEGN